MPLGLAILATLVLSFVGGMAIERVIIRPVEGGETLTLVIVTLGLFILLNSAAGWIWGFNNRALPERVPRRRDRRRRRRRVASSRSASSPCCSASSGCCSCSSSGRRSGWPCARWRINPESSRLAGIRVGRTLMIGWGLAAAGRRARRRAGRAAAVPGRELHGRRC